jgi:hypothetical protein
MKPSVSGVAKNVSFSNEWLWEAGDEGRFDEKLTFFATSLRSFHH